MKKPVLQMNRRNFIKGAAAFSFFPFIWVPKPLEFKNLLFVSQTRGTHGKVLVDRSLVFKSNSQDLYVYVGRAFKHERYPRSGLYLDISIGDAWKDRHYWISSFEARSGDLVINDVPADYVDWWKFTKDYLFNLRVYVN